MWVQKICNQIVQVRGMCTQNLAKDRFMQHFLRTKIQLPEPEYDINFFCNSMNRNAILENIQHRNSIANIDKIIELSVQPNKKDELFIELSKLPNHTHPAILEYNNEPRVLRKSGEKKSYDFKPQQFIDIANQLKLIKMQHLSLVSEQRSYVLIGDLANLEEALVYYTLKKLLEHGFKIYSVPDIIPGEIIERCGIIWKDRDMVYNLFPFYGNYSLCGTAEMSLANKLLNAVLPIEELPIKMAAVSRCYRAETSKISSEKGIYRVHYFTKVEMFMCSEQEKSEQHFEELIAIQEELFSSLGLHFQVVDMPPADLGLPAYRKVDIEGWMPGKQTYGELSSCSNCTDYQARRLNIKYRSNNGELLHVHTLNGTACAIPRMLIALGETYQTKHGRIDVHENLLPYMNGVTRIKKQPLPQMAKHKYKPTII